MYHYVVLVQVSKNLSWMKRQTKIRPGAMISPAWSAFPNGQPLRKVNDARNNKGWDWAGSWRGERVKHSVNAGVLEESWEQEQSPQSQGNVMPFAVQCLVCWYYPWRVQLLQEILKVFYHDTICQTHPAWGQLHPSKKSYRMVNLFVHNHVLFASGIAQHWLSPQRRVVFQRTMPSFFRVYSN